MRFCLFILLLFTTLELGAQRNELSAEPLSRTSESPADTSSQKPSRNGFFDIFQGKPGKAALFSLLVPGGGQLYNRKYWKVPLAIGLDAWAFWYARSLHNLYNEYDAAFKNMLIDPDYIFEDFNSASEVKLYRDAYRQRMEYAYIYLGLAHLATIIDAFVDRHLMNFDISEDLSMRIIQEPLDLAIPMGNYAGIGLRINLNSKKKTPTPKFLISP